MTRQRFTEAEAESKIGQKIKTLVEFSCAQRN